MLGIVDMHGLGIGLRLLRFSTRPPHRGAQRQKGRQGGDKTAAEYPVQYNARVHNASLMTG